MKQASHIYGLLIAALLVTGITAPLFAQQANKGQLEQTEKLFALQFTDAKRDSMLDGLNGNIKLYEYLHRQNIANNLAFPSYFNPVLPGMHFTDHQQAIHWNIPAKISLPKNRNDLAFYSIEQLASLLRSHQISSVELTTFFIDRLKKYGNTLHCVIEITNTIAMQQAKKADANFAKGIDKSPLQGIPYGIKDLFAAKGTHTTWGTPPYRNQVMDENSYVAQKLEDAGAVLIAKLSLGELAMDDIWFGGMTRNPWNIATGSGGSSAGSAASTAAGLVAFAIGTETYGSIVDPSMRCGVTGLRPSFGSISRSGAMALAWSSDKVGILAKSAEDAAVVFAYLHGTDGLDGSAVNMPFNYTGISDIHKLKIAYAANYIDSIQAYSFEKQVIATIQQAGGKVTPLIFPDTLKADALLSLIIAAESAAAFDPLTRANLDDSMVQQWKDRWPNVFRTGRFVPAVEYINAIRMRYRIMQQADPILEQYDIIITPPETGDQLAVTNLTGHPSVTVPIGFNKAGMPIAISFIGKLYQEAELLAFVHWYQQHTAFHLKHPAAFTE